MGLRLLASLLCLCSGTSPAAAPAFYAAPFEKQPKPAQISAIGRAMFFDASLSASGKLACASCHDPKHAYGPPNDRAVQIGGSGMRATGGRAVPSLRYLQAVPPFTEHFIDNDGDDSVDQGPAGGYTWDGRAQSAHDQARLPLLSPLEMANASAADIVAKLRRARYAAQIRETFGEHTLDDETIAFRAALLSLEVFQQEPSEFYPYDSRYDAYLRGKATLSEPERRGLALFENPAKGNCASCHPGGMRRGAFPQFTDFGFAALGVPRNRTIPANTRAGHFDLGLCGPLRTDLRSHAEYCGRFRAPTLRNAATRRVFFHNGAVHSLEEAVRFYATRDTAPEDWYPRGHIYDDLPAKYRGNVEQEPPFGRHRGDPPALTEAEIGDIVAFLKTLSDGYRP